MDFLECVLVKIVHRQALSVEQQQRMERSRQLALERRAARLSK